MRKNRPSKENLAGKCSFPASCRLRHWVSANISTRWKPCGHILRPNPDASKMIYLAFKAASPTAPTSTSSHPVRWRVGWAESKKQVLTSLLFPPIPTWRKWAGYHAWTQRWAQGWRPGARKQDWVWRWGGGQWASGRIFSVVRVASKDPQQPCRCGQAGEETTTGQHVGSARAGRGPREHFRLPGRDVMNARPCLLLLRALALPSFPPPSPLTRHE